MTTYQAAVIIPSRGGAPKLHYPLDALEAQTEKNFQVIVVLDGDIDNSAAVVQNYIDRGRLNLSMIVFDQNQGRVAALNAGHRAADAEILIRCDDDLQPDRSFIAKHLRHHQSPGEIGVIGIYKNIFPDTPYARVYGCYRDQKFREDAYLTKPESRWKYWAGNVSMSKTLFDQIGGYDDRYRLYGWEDVDMGYMVYRAGAKIIIDPELSINHFVAATTTANRAKRALYSGAARNLFIAKNGEGVLTPAKPTGLWGLLVRTSAIFATDSSIATAGQFIDLLSKRVQPRLAEKLVSLLVESSSYAGTRYPHRAQKNF
ncbi:glycosyltransferase family 2 protein [Rothia sp. CCM 9417]|uniref:glycosyltransferase family 2 protein n=1 Tax=Rothia sp. CCM 9417 TaxID=3402657 RepID=UPI003ADE0918